MTTAVDDAPTRDDIEEAIRGHLATMRRMPDHWTERRAGLHGKIDALLDEWETARG